MILTEHNPRRWPNSESLSENQAKRYLRKGQQTARLSQRHKVFYLIQVSGVILNNEFIEFIEWIVNAATATNKTNVVHSTLESLPGGELKVRCRPKTALTKIRLIRCLK